MSMSDVDAVVNVVGAIVVLLTLVAHLPYVRGTKASEFLVKAGAVDVVGVLRVVLSLLASKSPPPKPPEEE